MSSRKQKTIRETRVSKFDLQTIIYTKADKVLSSLLSGNDGIFQRDSIMVEEGEAGEGRRVVLWTFQLEKAGKIVEWLVRMTTKKD